MLDGIDAIIDAIGDAAAAEAIASYSSCIVSNPG